MKLAFKLCLQVFNPGEYICWKGNTDKQIYLIKEGKLAVVVDDGVIQYDLPIVGCWFGMISILNVQRSKMGKRWTASIKSINFSDQSYLLKKDLVEAVAECPEDNRS